MNYLAHAYFSFNDPAIMVGNLISDFIKGKKQYDYPADIQQGIRLHRQIDTFTDAHPALERAKQVFRPHYRLYSGAFVDVSFDYFLANDARYFEKESDLENFSQEAYQNLRLHEAWLPKERVRYFENMQKQNWLYHYRSTWGIQKSFGGIVYRSKYLDDSETAFRLFEENIPVLQEVYNSFIPDLEAMVSAWKPIG